MALPQAIKPKPWTFTQLGKPFKGPDKFPQTRLQDYQAPFGRPRHGEIVNAGLTVRQSTTYYPGDGLEPTVHEFGTMRKPWELKGRWMDRAMGAPGGAHQWAQFWRSFVDDRQIVRAVWGNLLSYKVFIDDLDLNYESEAEVAWQMKMTVIKDESAEVPPSVPMARRPPLKLANQMADEMKTIQKIHTNWTLSSILALANVLSDAIGLAVSALLAPFAAVYDICSAITSFESAVASDLYKLGSALSELRSSLLMLMEGDLNSDAYQEPIDTLSRSLREGLTVTLSSSDERALATYVVEADVATANLLALTADMQNQIDLALRQQVSTLVVAQQNDTFESIASKTMGGASGGRAIRDMNTVRYGQKPIPGKSYTIPNQ